MSSEVVTGAFSPDAGERLNLQGRIVIFMGPEGCGKSNVSKRVASASGLPIVPFGDTFRGLAQTDTGTWGDECREMIAQKRYMKPEILFQIMPHLFKRDDLANGFIIDGAMRSYYETIHFHEVLEETARVMPVINVFLRIPGWIGMDRIVRNNDARGRPTDDTVSGTLSRLSEYYKELAKRTSFLRNHPDWKFIHIDGRKSEEEMFADVRAALAKETA